MKNNDLDNHPLPRLALVFEGALGFLTTQDEPKFNRLMERNRWKEAVELFELNDYLMRIIWDRVWRLDLTIDVITYLGPDGWAEAIAERLGQEQLPVNQIWATTPKKLARKLPMMPDLIRVYDPYPEHVLYFGRAGVLFTDANQLGR